MRFEQDGAAFVVDPHIGEEGGVHARSCATQLWLGARVQIGKERHNIAPDDGTLEALPLDDAEESVNGMWPGMRTVAYTALPPECSSGVFVEGLYSPL